MGMVSGIGIDQFPRQHKYLGLRVDVCFNFDPTRTVAGVIVRMDDEEPGVTIIRLDDGRHVLATECQYSFRAAVPQRDK